MYPTETRITKPKNKNFPIAKPLRLSRIKGGSTIHRLCLAQNLQEKMGCGESKHVATGNTISRKNSKAESKRGKPSQTIEETSKPVNNASSTLVPDEGKNVNQISGESTALKKEENAETDKEKKSTAMEETKLADQETKIETKGENAEVKTLAGVTKVETVQEIKPAEEKKEDIVEDKKPAEEKPTDTEIEVKKLEEKPEEVEGKKPAEEKPEEMEDKKLGEEKPEEMKDEKMAGEKPEETANGESETVKEENLVKGTETAETETTEAEFSTPVAKEEEAAAVSPDEDLKTE